ncbi:hypothetical protein [Chitinophaga ginsengisoli]|uniref:Uncharacterized protein n=1 Tax=Chitinophaga ginsengisoli TaxID=363837 RepID=A0A2P8FZA1_9BACT|nr:hypothetical protein [Chitinophaga ginsengisoli]PSL26975.1 hypothetical protein CLV42_110128 [Chitinophaga ginsengisoli]
MSPSRRNKRETSSKNLKTKLTIQAGSSCTFRGDDMFPPMHPEMEYWIDWLETYEYFRDEGNVVMPEEDDE